MIKKGSTSLLYLAIGKQKFSEKAEDLLITYMPSIAERKNYVTLASDYYSLHGFSNRQKLLALENAPCVDKALVAQIRREFVSAWGVNITDEENKDRVIFLLKCGDDEIVEAFKNIAAMVVYCYHVEAVVEFWQRSQSKGAYALGIAEMNAEKVQQRINELMPSDEVLDKLIKWENMRFYKDACQRLEEVEKWFKKQFLV